MTFQLSPYTDKNKIFLVKKSSLSGRLDVNFYLPKYIDSENLIRNSEWGFKSISDIAERIVDGPFGSDLKAEEYQDSGFPLLRVSNIRTGSIDGELVYISSEKHNDLKRSKVFPNDVLLTKAGAILGYSAVFPSGLIEGNITSHLVTITCRSKVNPYYLSYFFRSKIGQLQIYRWGNKSTRPELNTGEVKKILVTIPPLDIQNEIVYKFDNCYKAKYKKENEAQKLLDSIDDYLLGELGVTKLEQDADYLQSRIFMRSYRDVSGGRVDPYFYKNIYLGVIESLDIIPKSQVIHK
jgi:restriction endonuclease S subunit